MKIKLYGTRGSTAISNPNSVIYGGNTTNLRIYSDCIPKDTLLAVDAGTGFLPMSMDGLKEGGKKNVTILFTHYHHDHTQGLFLSPYLFIKDINLRLIGPIDTGVGPKKMIQTLVRPPYFPVHYKEIESHLSYEGFDFLQTVVIIYHPIGGQKTITKKAYETILKDGAQLKMGKTAVSIKECLVISMHKSNHPEHTVSYRFEEKPTGKTFVFMTDHENQDGLSHSLRDHIIGADFLVMDSQYTKEQYEKSTAGFGHGTPDYCARIAKEVGVKMLGLTHHDPTSTDADVDNITKSAIKYAADPTMIIFTVKDYQEIEL